MTVAAVEADATDVVRVAELDGLLDELVLLGDPPGAHQGEDDPSTGEHQAEDTAARLMRAVALALRGKSWLIAGCEKAP